MSSSLRVCSLVVFIVLVGCSSKNGAPVAATAVAVTSGAVATPIPGQSPADPPKRVVVSTPTPTPTMAPKAVPLPTIVCTLTGVSIAGANQISFSAANCGGTLPDNHYVGILDQFLVSGGTSGEYILGQPSNGEVPSIFFVPKTAGGNYAVRAVYLPTTAAVVRCAANGQVGAAGPHTLVYSSAQCSDVTDANAVGVLSRFLVNGGTSGELVVGQPVNGESESVGYYASAAGGNYDIAVLYFKPAVAPITCTNTGTNESAATIMAFHDANCAGGVVPRAGYVGLLSRLQVNGGTSGEYNVADGQVSYWSLSGIGVGNYAVQSLYLPTGAPKTATGGRATIVCTATGVIPAQGQNLISFSAAQCSGGVLPSGDYAAIPATVQVNGGASGEIVVSQPVNGGAASILFYSFAAAGQGSYAVKVAYLPVDRDNTVTCTATGALTAAGPHTVNFSAGQCNGSQLPSAEYVAIPATIQVNGGTSGEHVLGQPVNGQAPSIWFYSLAAAGNYGVQVVYVKAGPAITCTAGGVTPAAGGNSVNYSYAKCNGSLPRGNYVSIPSTILSNGGTSGEFSFGQPVENGLDNVYWYAKAANAGYSMSAVYVRGD